jgi:hypothetical protein
MPVPSEREGTNRIAPQAPPRAPERADGRPTDPLRARNDVVWSEPVAGRDVAQVLGVVGGPLALLTGLLAKYTLVEIWACKSGAGPIVVHLVALGTLLLVLAFGALALTQWRAAGREEPGDVPGYTGRTRMAATLGVGLSAMSAVVVIAQWLPQFFVSPCQP